MLEEVILSQSKLQFSFDTEKEWKCVIAADKNTDIKNIKSIPSFKDVDIIAIYQTETIESAVFIEVTNYKQSSTYVPSIPNFAVEFAEKIKDSLAIIVSGARSSTHYDQEWQKIAKIIVQKDSYNMPKNPIYAVIWLEEDLSKFTKQEIKHRKAIIIEKIEQKLFWLTSRVWLTDIEENEINPFFSSFNATQK